MKDKALRKEPECGSRYCHRVGYLETMSKKERERNVKKKRRGVLLGDRGKKSKGGKKRDLKK